MRANRCLIAVALSGFLSIAQAATPTEVAIEKDAPAMEGIARGAVADVHELEINARSMPQSKT